jgi:hypothetical protein
VTNGSKPVTFGNIFNLPPLWVLGFTSLGPRAPRTQRGSIEVASRLFICHTFVAAFAPEALPQEKITTSFVGINEPYDAVGENGA